jgi:hypothetical protein
MLSAAEQAEQLFLGAFEPECASLAKEFRLRGIKDLHDAMQAKERLLDLHRRQRKLLGGEAQHLFDQAACSRVHKEFVKIDERFRASQQQDRKE